MFMSVGLNVYPIHHFYSTRKGMDFTIHFFIGYFLIMTSVSEARNLHFTSTNIQPNVQVVFLSIFCS